MEDLKIEVSRIHKLDGLGPTKAFCDLSIADSLMIKGLRIIEGQKGLFVAMPSEEGKDGKWYSIVMPLKRDVKDEIERIVLEAYNA
ncbi:MAG: SpoVG family protein [Candidatus Omnitrophica bacterium]|nr:SpoVG family protein [Candidatus Omnitrophota bacterium]